MARLRAIVTTSEGPDDLEDRFIVESSNDAVNWSVAATTDADAIATEVSGLSGTPIWFFRVRRANFIGASLPSDLVPTSASPNDLPSSSSVMTDSSVTRRPC